MELLGHVENGVIVLHGGVQLPEGASVVVAYPRPEARKPNGTRVKFPLVRSLQPGSLQLTPEKVADLLSEEDVTP